MPGASAGFLRSPQRSPRLPIHRVRGEMISTVRRPAMILQAMLQRLYASLARGPGLNARPHQSRQRIDLTELAALGAPLPDHLLRNLLAQPSRALEFSARVPTFREPEYPEPEWSDEQKAAARADQRQTGILGKLRDIAADATDYYNDHGENALFIGFPLVSIPASSGRGGRNGFQTKNLLAPVLLAPVNLRVRQGSRAGMTIEAAGEGGDLVVPNPALLAWIEQQTGENTDAVLDADDAKDPWREVRDTLELVIRATGLVGAAEFGPDTPLQSVPRTDALPDSAALIPSAVLGLFPITNPGLLRDTKWMIENESGLANPALAFLAPRALSETDHALPAAREWDHTRSPGAETIAAAPVSPTGRPDAEGESGRYLVTHADPCQAEAVRLVRHSAALVIHGPPGTGKSQTIANVVGDHLARGQRVLFVCDKRTALDVVKYRLDGMGLGELCGVIHDPAHDRRALYLALRDRLENLPEQAVISDPAAALQHVNQRLTQLHAELREAFARLQSRDEEAASFHDLTGRWLALRADIDNELPAIEGLDASLVDAHRADIGEVLRRAPLARWKESPFRNRLGIRIDAWLSLAPAAAESSLRRILETARALDETRVLGAAASDSGPALPPALLAPAVQAFATQSSSRRRLADLLDAVLRRAHARLATLGVSSATLSPHHARLHALAAETPLPRAPLDRELLLAVGPVTPALGEIKRRLAALDAWAAKTGSLQRLIAFAEKKAAREALAPLGLRLEPADLERARGFYHALRARWLWSDFRAQVLGETLSDLIADAELHSLHDGLLELFAIHDHLSAPELAGFEKPVDSLLPLLSTHGASWIAVLRRSADRADTLEAWHRAALDSALFTDEAIHADLTAWLGGAAAVPAAERQLAHADTLDEAVRLADRLALLPAPIRRALEAVIDLGLDLPAAETALLAAALASTIRERIRSSPALARIDTQRVEAAFAELAERTAEKQQLVRAHVLHRWRKLWRERLLAGTGTRLNSAGASLRQRLFVRGERALKLRQMIAAGADHPVGDPLFDLCPVWMASPATVAQIFPRTPIFDVIVFDEASQCRLEEALPVMLRGRRVVIAGDPKQLPPTRFFEQSLAESDDTGAETADEVFAQQQSEAEDLLAAALNLEVQEAFLDVHYRSRNEALIGFSNEAFYTSRLQPIPGHPRNKALRAPIRLKRVDGAYENRGNLAEARAAADLVAELLDNPSPPSIGIACFNLNQRDLILDALDERAAVDRVFAERLDFARKRRGRDSFEGLFVKNLENVQGDERDHMIICTTFGIAKDGKFRRNFGALSQVGGERRLNVLVTRARDAIHVLTSIPRAEYLGSAGQEEPRNGRHLLYAYLLYAERLEALYQSWQNELETARRDAAPACSVLASGTPSLVAEAIGQALHRTHGVGSTVHWGNDGFCIDLALTHPEMPEDVTIGVLTDFNRYRKTPDPVAWELFRAIVLRSQGWELHRVWTPGLFRDASGQLERIVHGHRTHLKRQRESGPPVDPTTDTPAH